MTTNETTTITTLSSITNAQITGLRASASEAWDIAMVRICDRALRGSMRARRECVRVISYGEARSAK